MTSLAGEADFQNKFPDRETGARPPFGNLYGMPDFVDEAIAVRGFMVFNAGSHTELVRLASNMVVPKVL